MTDSNGTEARDRPASADDPGNEAVRRFGQVVKARREDLGMSQTALAAAIGRSAGTVSAIEQGRRSGSVSGRTMSALDRALGWAQGSARDVLDGGEPVELRAPFEGVTVHDESQDNIRALVDEVSLAAPGDRDLLIGMLVAAARAWRDGQGRRS